MFRTTALMHLSLGSVARRQQEDYLVCTKYSKEPQISYLLIYNISS